MSKPNAETLKQQAADLLAIVHLSMNWDVWGTKRLKYWDVFQENVAASAYTDNLAKWLNTLCNRMSVLTPGRNEKDRVRLEEILNGGHDRAQLKLLREETQLLVLMVRVNQQVKKELRVAEDVAGAEMALDAEDEGLSAAALLFAETAAVNGNTETDEQSEPGAQRALFESEATK